MRNAIYNVCVEAIKIKSIFQVKHYAVYETADFKVMYTEQDRDIAYLVSNTIEKDFARVKRRLNHHISTKIQIIIYPDLETMREKLDLTERDYPMGIYYGGILHILSPKVWIKSNNMSIVSREFEKNGPMVHELVHLIVDQKTNGNFPLWFTEGVALYYEYQLTGYEWGEELGNIYNSSSLAQLTHYFDTLDKDIAYRQSFEIIKKIADIYGEEKILSLLDQLGRGQIGLTGKVSLESVVNNLIQ